ncbi:MAG: UpxY family transcription antiterminator [bacterium]
MIDEQKITDDSHFCWYALYTRSRHEKKVERQLSDKGIDSYLPMRKVLRRWSDRKKWVEEPLFGCYVFIHADAMKRYQAVQTYGSVRIVHFNGQPAVVRDEEIDNIRRILSEVPSAESCPAVSVGDAVEIIRGPLTGFQGTLEEIRHEKRFVVSIPSIRQALRFNIDGMDVRAVERLKAV